MSRLVSKESLTAAPAGPFDWIKPGVFVTVDDNLDPWQVRDVTGRHIHLVGVTGRTRSVPWGRVGEIRRYEGCSGCSPRR